MSDTQQLNQLQQIDTKIIHLTKRLAEVKANLNEPEALKAAKIEAEKAEATQSQLKATVTDLELEITGLQDKIKTQETRLYSGEVLNPKEAASLQDDIQANKSWLDNREENLLNLMIQLEEVEEDYEQSQQNSQKIQAQWEITQESLLNEGRSRQSELQRLTQQRPKVVQLIDQADLQIYETLRRKKGGLGVAVIEDDTCTACGVLLSNRIIQQALSGDKLYYCEGCGRIMLIS